MNIEKTWCFILPIAIFIFSCSTKRKQDISANATRVTINNSKITSDYYIDSLIESYDVVPLETNEKGLFGNLNGMFALKEKIYVVDKYNSKSLFIFSANGKFINKLSAIGEGPGEFKTLQACKVDSGGIYIFDGSLSKILRYNLNGEFVEEHRLPHFYKTNFIRYDNKKYLFYNAGEATIAQGGYKLIAWDATRKEREKLYMPIEREYSKCVYYTDEQHFFGTPDGPLFFELFNDTIYSFNPKRETLTAKYILNFEEGKLPINFPYDHTVIDKFKEVNNKKYAAFSGRFIELSDFLFFKYNYKQAEECFIWDKTRNRTVANSNDLGIDTLSIRLPNWNKGFGNNQIIVKYESYELIEWLKQMKKERIDCSSNRLAKVAASLKADDNPVLLLLNLKSESQFK